ncbi:hypothetical protein FRC14_004860 [Serendipita sp. 396]|nr:hypothetical protein FRC14_004860 [Serendipita sp. 396]
MPPGWQTDELAEEWIEEGEHNDASGRGVIQESSTHNAYLMQDSASSPLYSSTKIVGTMIVHPATTLKEGRLPLARRIGLLDNNIFSPLKLEAMFRPPDPPMTDTNDPQGLQQAPDIVDRRRFEFDKNDARNGFSFTFNQPVPPTPSAGKDIQQSKLRLFQFEYDAYTKEHLSALVDSIPVESSSKSTTPHQYSDFRDTSGCDVHRPAKRIKICIEDEGRRRKTNPPGKRSMNASQLLKRHIELARAPVPGRHDPHNSLVACRSTASSTINASESSRSLTADELALKLRQVALVSTDATEGRHDGIEISMPFSLPAKRNQPRFPSSATTITHIGPNELCPLPEQVGRMRFDAAAMKWVRRMGEESDDPFRDVESFKESPSPAIAGPGRPGKLIESPLEKEASLGVFISTGDAQRSANQVDQSIEDIAQGAFPQSTMGILPVAGTPMAVHFTSRPAPTPIRSALKATSTSTPLSGNAAGVNSSSTKQRCVSFSDGRFAGRIKGLHPGESEDESGESGFVPTLREETSLRPSFRTKRIADMLDELDGHSFEDDDDSTPCRPSAQQQLSKRESLLSSFISNGLSKALSRSEEEERSMRIKDATFLTECSFEVAHDRLLQCITDVQPFEPHWEKLTSIDLSGKALDSLARLKEFLPKLEELIIDDNKIGWLSGIPGGIRFLSAASNLLTSLTSYAHFGQLECLDISKNGVNSLLQLECLHRLRELKADHNEIVDLNGLVKLTRLRKLSLIANRLRHVDLSGTTWHDLEYLDLSRNRLETVKGLHTLSKVNFVNLDENAITRLDIGGIMSGLRCFRLSDNRLEGTLDVRQLVNVKILYADRNRLRGLIHTEKLKRLETLSLRYQGGNGLVVSAKDVRDVRRLYLSGNPMSEWFLDEPCYNLIYLELADCKLTRIPKEIGRVIPNVRVLNLNYNFVSELEGLEQLRRLKKVSMIGSHLRGTKGIVRAMRGMSELEMVDFRMNPCTVSWYVPLLAEESQKGNADADEEKDEWAGLDAKFRRGLPDELYAGRLVYRGMLMEGCERLKMIDGLRVSEGERDKARELLARVQQQDVTGTGGGGKGKGKQTGKHDR